MDTNSYQQILSTQASRYNWQHEAVLLLIAERRKKSQLFNSPSLKKLDVWSMIATELQQHGYQVTADACDKKWRNLKDRYKVIRKTHSEVDAGPIRWDYYNAMDDILFNDRTCFPERNTRSLSLVNSQRPRAPSESDPCVSPQPDLSAEAGVSGAPDGETEEANSSNADIEPVVDLPSLFRRTPGRKRKWVPEDEPPQWLVEHLDKQNKTLEEISESMSKRNDILKCILNALLESK